MSDLTFVTAAPRPFKLPDGREFWISPLTLGEWGEFIAWVQEQRQWQIESASERSLEDLGLEAFVDLSDPGMMIIACSEESEVRQMQMHLRRRHPDATAATAQALIAAGAFDVVRRLRETKKTSSGKTQKVVYAKIYRDLAELHGWGPNVVSQMTLPQALMYLEDGDGIDPRTGHRTRRVGSLAEARALLNSLKQTQ